MEKYIKIKKGIIICVTLFAWVQTAANVNETCQQTTSDVLLYGLNCDMMCHCMNQSEICDSVTGECISGCDFDWGGPGCQYKNVAFDQESRHLDNINPLYLYSFRANDDNVSTCSYTNHANTSGRDVSPWWRVWFTKNQIIRGLTIVTEDEHLEYFTGFNVSVETIPTIHLDNNTYYSNNTTLCYKHNGSAPAVNTIEVMCYQPIEGNQVRIQLLEIQSQLILCDVRIYGGRNVAFRQHASKSWNHQKNWYSASKSVDGTKKHRALNGCSKVKKMENPWWKVDIGYSAYIDSVSIFGLKVLNYTLAISNDANDWNTVHNDSGVNPYTAAVLVRSVSRHLRIERPGNVTLILCEVEIFGDCQQEFCGFDCSAECHCKNITLEEKMYGHCTTGCKSGWKGGGCDKECINGTYGTMCYSNCSEHCSNGSVCRHTDGVCTEGCDPGWEGDMCDAECREGTFGTKCSSNCSGHCLNGSVCRQTDGVCTNGCDPGWKGGKCDTSCDRGTYGPTCSYNCSGHCANGFPCRNTDGNCTEGCIQGWTGEQCNSICVSGRYGSRCSYNCSGQCANNTACRHIDGHCIGGCIPGWGGEQCNISCASGKYGANCTLSCSEYCANNTCRSTDGTCTEGCKHGWTGNLCKKVVTEAAPQTDGQSSTTIAGGISAASIVIVVVAAVAILCWKRGLLVTRLHSLQRWYFRQRRTENSFENITYQHDHSETSVSAENEVDLSITVQHTNTGPVYNNTQLTEPCLNDGAAGGADDTVYCNTLPTQRTPHAIPVSEIAIFIKQKCTVKGFQSEFETIGTGLLYPTCVAERPENRNKNRFKKVFPYDHSRVTLKRLHGKHNSDYINACFIMNQEKEKAYIAAQGPTKENVDDFWRMILEVDVRTIVMVTNLTELGKVKCIQYWGDKDVDMQYGQIYVTMQAENVYAECTVRVFRLFHQADVKTNREITQFHYTAWPDKGIPRTTSGLLHFWGRVRQSDRTKSHPWLVHCSAGVGRTGTFLALDILYDQGQQLGFIDVHQCVRDLRDQRANMVQTNNQYIFLHMLMQDLFCLPSRPVSVDEFVRVYGYLQEKDKTSGKTRLALEYELLGKALTVLTTTLNVDEEEENVDASLGVSTIKNAIKTDEFRPILSTYVPGGPNLIKAAYIPSYFDRHGYIIAQYPLENTKMETCRLVYEKGIELVITFANNPRHTVKMSSLEDTALDMGPFAVHCNVKREIEDWIVKEYALLVKDRKHFFTEIVFKHWSSDSLVPNNPESMLNLMAEIEQQQLQESQETRRKTVMFQCWNGAERSGLMVMLMNMMDRARLDCEVSIPQLLRQLRHVKKDIVPNFEQYTFCYEVLYRHIESNATYANV